MNRDVAEAVIVVYVARRWNGGGFSKHYEINLTCKILNGVISWDMAPRRLVGAY
jgi:hypothetical protein